MQSLALFSDDISLLVTQAAPYLVAIRVGLNRHIAGIRWGDNLVVTSDRALPAQDAYTLMLAGGALIAARPLRRDSDADIALLHLDAAGGGSPMPPGAASVGGVILALGVEADASPTARLTLIRRLVRGASPYGPTIVMDMPGATADQGGPVLDARGGLVGMAGIGPLGDAIVIPWSAIARTIEGVGIESGAGDLPFGSQPMVARPVAGRPHFSPTRKPPPAPSPSAASSGKRGWLGVAFGGCDDLGLVPPVTVSPIRHTDPVADRLRGRFELPGKIVRIATGADRIDYLSVKLRRVRRVGFGQL